LTTPVLESPKSIKVFEFPPVNLVADYKLKGVYLAGFECPFATCDSSVFNFIMSDGTSSKKLPGAY